MLKFTNQKDISLETPRPKDHCFVSLAQKFLSDRNYEDIKIDRSIERNLHFIWLGGALPNLYLENLKTFCRKTNHFDIKLWSDYPQNHFDIDNLEVCYVNDFLNFKNSSLFNSSKNFGTKSDILRYDILYNFGGLYLDLDCFFLNDGSPYIDKSFILSNNTFPGVHKNPATYLHNNWAMSAYKGHPFFKFIVDFLPYNYSYYLNNCDKGLSVITLAGPIFLSRWVYFFNPDLLCVHAPDLLKNFYNHRSDKKWKK